MVWRRCPQPRAVRGGAGLTVTDLVSSPTPAAPSRSSPSRALQVGALGLFAVTLAGIWGLGMGLRSTGSFDRAPSGCVVPPGRSEPAVRPPTVRKSTVGAALAPLADCIHPLSLPGCVAVSAPPMMPATRDGSADPRAAAAFQPRSPHDSRPTCGGLCFTGRGIAPRPRWRARGWACRSSRSARRARCHSLFPLRPRSATLPRLPTRWAPDRAFPSHARRLCPA